MSKVDTAIQCAYETLSYIKRKGQISRHVNDMIDLSLSAMEQFYKNPAATYTEERDAYWKEMMDVHFDGHFKDFSPEQVEKMLAWFRDWDTDLLYGSMDDILWNALHENGLDSLVYGD